MPDKERATRNPHSGTEGIAVDQHGGPVIDPTENVIALTEAANQRQDDLRAAADRLHAASIDHLKEIVALRADHQQQMLLAEASRLNSIRQVDQSNVQTAADRQLAAIQTLAVTTAANAENLRNALNTTATTIAVQTAQTVAQINERLAALEKQSYTGQGKEAVADPMIAQMVGELKLMREQQVGSAGKSSGMTALWGLIVGGVVFIGGLIGIGTFVFVTSRPSSTPPQVIYTPAPAGTQLPTVPPGSVPR